MRPWLPLPRSGLLFMLRGRLLLLRLLLLLCVLLILLRRLFLLGPSLLWFCVFLSSCWAGLSCCIFLSSCCACSALLSAFLLLPVEQEPWLPGS